MFVTEGEREREKGIPVSDTLVPTVGPVSMNHCCDCMGQVKANYFTH